MRVIDGAVGDKVVQEGAEPSNTFPPPFPLPLQRMHTKELKEHLSEELRKEQEKLAVTKQKLDIDRAEILLVTQRTGQVGGDSKGLARGGLGAG